MYKQVTEQLIISNEAEQNTCAFPNYRWLEFYNKCIWMLCDILRTVLLIATLSMFSDVIIKFMILVSFLLLFILYCITNIYQHYSSPSSEQSLTLCLCSIPLSLMIYIFQHIRFHDSMLHIDRDTQYVGWLKVLGFVDSKTDHIAKYILKDNNINNVKHRIIAANYYILSKFKDSLEQSMTMQNDPGLLIEYIATIHNKNIDHNYRKYYDIKWKDIRDNLDDGTIWKLNKKRFIRTVLFGVYLVLTSFLMMLALFVIVYMDHSSDDASSKSKQKLQWIGWVYLIYFLLEIYVILIEYQHCKFAFYFYHLLTSVQPLQTNNDISWKGIKIEYIDIICDIMYGYQHINYTLINKCGVHPDISKIICTYLVSPLPENGDIDDIDTVMNNVCYEEEELLIESVC